MYTVNFTSSSIIMITNALTKDVSAERGFEIPTLGLRVKCNKPLYHETFTLIFKTGLSYLPSRLQKKMIFPAKVAGFSELLPFIFISERPLEYQLGNPNIMLFDKCLFLKKKENVTVYNLSRYTWTL